MKYFTLIFLIYNIAVFGQINDSLDSYLDEEIKYKELDFDTTYSVHNIQIGTKKYVIEIFFYSLNDSLLTEGYSYVDHLNGEILDSYLMKTHNNQGVLKVKHDKIVLLSQKIDKTLSRDTVSSNYYKAFTIWDLKFERIENNKIILSSFFGSSCGSVGFFVNYLFDIEANLLEVNYPIEVWE